MEKKEQKEKERQDRLSQLKQNQNVCKDKTNETVNQKEKPAAPQQKKKITSGMHRFESSEDEDDSKHQ